MKKLIFLFVLLAMVACKDQKKETEKTGANDTIQVAEEATGAASREAAEASQQQYDPASSDDQTAANIRNFLVQDYLAKDLEYLQENDRKFQYYAVDLNGDGKDEYFVNFMSSYFCGTGGCTVLLLDHESNIITKFTVMDNPIYVETAKSDGWSNILVRSGGELKELKYSKGKYPSNPSVVAKAPFDAPGSSDIIMFDDNFAKAKTYTF